MRQQTELNLEQQEYIKNNLRVANITDIAKVLNMHPGTLYRLKKNFPEISSLHEEIKQQCKRPNSRLQYRPSLNEEALQILRDNWQYLTMKEMAEKISREQKIKCSYDKVSRNLGLLGLRKSNPKKIKPTHKDLPDRFIEDNHFDTCPITGLKNYC